MHTTTEIQPSISFLENERELLHLNPNQFAIKIGEKALTAVEYLVALEGSIHEIMGLEVNAKLFNRLKLIEGIRRSGDWRDHYSEYLDKRVINVDSDGNYITEEMVKIRTCYMREHHYDPKNTGSHSQRTKLGRILTETGLDELPQILDSQIQDFKLELVGTRPRKIQDFYYVPESLRDRDLEVYNSLPFGVIDPHAPDRKKNMDNDMGARSAYSIAYANAITDNPHNKLHIDSAIVRTAVQELLPANNRAIKFLIKCALPKFVDGYIPMSYYESQITYDYSIRQPANKILQDIR